MVVKRRSSKKVIEATPHPEAEHSFIKYPGKEPEDITDYKRLGSRAYPDVEKAKKVIIENDLRPYTHIHTHPYQEYKFWPAGLFGAIERLIHRTGKTESKGIKEITGLPSGGDFNGFLCTNNMKTMVIAVRDPENGKVAGYHILRKTKNTPTYMPAHGEFEKAPVKSVLKGIGVMIQAALGLFKPVESYNYDVKRIKGLREDNLDKSRQAFEDLAHKYRLRYRMVAAEGYKVNETRTSFSDDRSPLEGKVAAFLSMASFSLCILFSSFRLTGNAIGFQSMAQNVGSIVLFFLGVLGMFFYFRMRR